MSAAQAHQTAPRPPTAIAISADSAKVVHLIRHGQGYHNVAAAHHGAAAYKDQTLRDSRLDETGRKQAKALGTQMRERRMQVDVVLVSPLLRTLETASLMFPPQGTTTTAAAASNVPSTRPPMVAIELCREAFGGHPCDQRSAVSVVSKEFGHVDFSLVETDVDTWHDPDRRETVREVSIRAEKFLEVLRNRPERNIAVVSHGVFLETLLNKCGLYTADDGTKGRRFDNCELRSYVIGGWSQ